MTSRQSEWSKPGDAQGNAIPGWGTNQLCGQGQVISPVGGVPGWAELLYGRYQAEKSLLTCNHLLHGSLSPPE